MKSSIISLASRRSFGAAIALGVICGFAAQWVRAEEKAKYLPAKAYVVPKYTCPEGEGYFSIIEGNNGRLYIGTHANAVNSWLVEFDPASEAMDVVVDTHKAIGTDLKGFGSQAKIHTRNNRGASGKIYFGTKQGYPNAEEKREDYPGGYPMVYDPETRTTNVYPIPVPHHGINSVTPDESRGIAYVSTCSDHRPGPGENAVFLKLDLKTGKYQELIDTEHYYGFIVVDHKGRAYHPLLGGDIARYNPDTDKLERLKQTIDGVSPTDETRLALTNPDPINWDISPDGKTLYAQPMSANALYAYDLTGDGETLPGRTVGTMIPGAETVDCRAMCCGPSGNVWSATTSYGKDGIFQLNMVRYRPGDKAPVDFGEIAVTNPDFTELTDKDGKPLPFHAGFLNRPDGSMTTRYVILGVCEAKDGNVYVMAMHPYSVLKFEPKAFER
ncbi:MAG: SMP-30/gluconolactonase/LRE family protein [Planctomycetaceae bacterium]